MNTREVAKNAIRDRIALAALVRFQENGFENTTVEEIASDMAMSKRTFFRYFKTKEDAVLDSVHTFKATFLKVFAQALEQGDLWASLGIALEETFRDCQKSELMHRGRQIQTLIRATPALLSRQLEIVESLQLEVTALYLSTCSEQGKHSWVATNAIVRSAFSCWTALECSGASEPATVPSDTLRELLHQMKPSVLVAC